MALLFVKNKFTKKFKDIEKAAKYLRENPDSVPGSFLVLERPHHYKELEEEFCIGEPEFDLINLVCVDEDDYIHATFKLI